MAGEEKKQSFAITIDTSRLLLPGEKVTPANLSLRHQTTGGDGRLDSAAISAPSSSSSDAVSVECSDGSDMALSSRGASGANGAASSSTNSGGASSSKYHLSSNSGPSLSGDARHSSSGESEEREPLVARSGPGVRKLASHSSHSPWSTQQLKGMVRDEDDDLEEGTDGQPQCRICLESDGRDFIAPCKCRGSSQFVHRACLDQWRSIKEGFAFAHCTTCKMRYHIRVHAPLDAKWRTMKFRFFVTRDALAITLFVQALTCCFGYFVYTMDVNLLGGSMKRSSRFQSDITFYYLCGLIIFFFMAGVLGCIFTCIDRRFRSDIGGPCRELCTCCFNPLIWGDCHCCSPLCLYADCSLCGDCVGATTQCLAAGGLGEATAMIFLTVGVVALLVFAVVGIFYSLVVAAVVAQRIWQRHYHILAKRLLTKEYVVEDLAGQDLTNYTPPSLPPEHEKQLRELGLLESR